MSEESDRQKNEWMDDAESALERIGESLRQAWSETRDARLATLEAAKEAASRLGDAIDQGISVVKETWSGRPVDAGEEPMTEEVDQEEE